MNKQKHLPKERNMNWFGETGGDSTNLEVEEDHKQMIGKPIPSTCGCGHPVRYFVKEGTGACNKYNRCPVDPEAFKFWISFANIDAKEAPVVAMFGEGANMAGHPTTVHNYLVFEEATRDYLQRVYALQQEIRKQILTRMLIPEHDQPATPADLEKYDFAYTKEQNSVWDC